MAQRSVAFQNDQPCEQREKYFSFQIRGWTDFDPMNKTLAKIAAGIDDANGFLTLVEVLKVEDNLASIEDEEARECFANTLAAKRLLKNIHELPKKVVEELRSALKTEEVISDKIVPPEPIPLLSEANASNAKPWL
jgi:hypothetical protein